MALYQALADYCTARKDFSQVNDREKLQQDWAKYHKIYRNYMSGSYPSKGKIHIPQTFATTFRLHSAIMSNVRRNRDIVRFIGEPKHDALAINSVYAADAMQQAAAYYIAKGRLLREVSKWELEAVTLGTSFMKTTWDYVESGDEQVVYDGFRFEHRPIYSIYVDPKAYSTCATVDDLEYIIDQQYMSIDDLFSGGKFFNRDEVVRANRASKRASMRDDSMVEQAVDSVMGTGNQGIEARDKESDQILVEKYWGKVPRKILGGRNKTNYDGNQDMKDFVEAFVIIAEGVVVWAQENPYPNGRKPYDLIRCYPAPNMFYGIGIPELIEPLQRAINAVTNQRIDNVGLVLNRMWAYRQNMVNPKHLVSRPGGFIPVRGPVEESLMPIVTPDVTNSAYREHDIYDNTIQKVSGVADIFFGHSTKSTRISATEATFMTEMGAGMMEEIVAGQVQDGFIPLMEKVRDYIQAFNTQTLSLNIDGQAVPISPDMLSGDFELIPTIGEQMFTKTAEMQKALLLLQTTVGLKEQLAMEGKEVRVSKILERVYENAGWKDYATIVSGATQGGGFPQETQAPGNFGQPGVLETGGGAEDDAGAIGPDLGALYGGDYFNQ